MPLLIKFIQERDSYANIKQENYKTYIIGG